MKKFILNFSVIILSILFTNHAYADYIAPSDVDVAGGVVPWPWGHEMPFPWYGIQGTWITKDTRDPVIFIFKVIRKNADGEKQLQLLQLDGKGCKVKASGYGIESDKVVTGQMSGLSGLTYQIRLSAFSEDDANRPALDKSSKVLEVMVATITLMEDYEAKTYHTQLAKLSDKVSIGTCRIMK